MRTVKHKLKSLSVATEQKTKFLDVVIHSFEKFLYFATNSLFYNFKTFCRFEAEYFSKKF